MRRARVEAAHEPVEPKLSTKATSGSNRQQRVGLPGAPPDCRDWYVRCRGGRELIRVVGNDEHEL
jgi:hypothetical protein